MRALSRRTRTAIGALLAAAALLWARKRRRRATTPASPTPVPEPTPEAAAAEEEFAAVLAHNQAGRDVLARQIAEAAARDPHA
jgi:hypothetical protein